MHRVLRCRRRRVERTQTDAIVDRETRLFLITGRVQGVNFRNSTRIAAERLAIGGYVRNRDDGSVEVLAHGSAAVLERLLEWLRHGPAGAEVKDVKELVASPEQSENQDGRPPNLFRVR